MAAWVAHQAAIYVRFRQSQRKWQSYQGKKVTNSVDISGNQCHGEGGCVTAVTAVEHRYELYQLVEVILQVRPEFKGRAGKKDVIALNGKKLILEVMWCQHPDDPYPGEYALGDSHRAPAEDRLFHLAGIAWISSGDVKFIRVVPREEIIASSLRENLRRKM